MDEIRYTVVFNGELLPGTDIAEAKRNLEKEFNLDPVKLEKLFSGRPVQIRKDVDHQNALRLQERFARAGAVCSIVPPDPLPEKMVLARCSKCGHEQPGQECLHCGVARAMQEELRQRQRPEAEQDPKQVAGAPEHRYPFRFTGSAAEYFRIWIVNLLLSLLTLGIYAAWAKVRTRRYFYANTLLAGDGFDYLADPKAILKGNLMIMVAFLLFVVSEHIHLGVKGALVVLFAALFPWLIYKSLRFMAHNSAFRNVRFSFLGSLKESYSTYLLMPLLMLPTLGIIFPYLAYRQKRYLYGNMAFGMTSNAFNGKAGPFYKYHAVVFALMIGMVVTASLGMGIVTALGVLLVNTSQPPSTSLIVAMVGSFYLLFLLGTTFIRQYLFSRITNYCWSSSILGGVCFESTLRTRRLFWISLTNILAILFSFGLLFPWAKVRRTRYVLENLSLVSGKGLDEFESASGEQVSAIGDSAMDFFNFEIGL